MKWTIQKNTVKELALLTMTGGDDGIASLSPVLTWNHHKFYKSHNIFWMKRIIWYSYLLRNDASLLDEISRGESDEADIEEEEDQTHLKKKIRTRVCHFRSILNLNDYEAVAIGAKWCAKPRGLRPLSRGFMARNGLKWETLILNIQEIPNCCAEFLVTNFR